MKKNGIEAPGFKTIDDLTIYTPDSATWRSAKNASFKG